MPKYRVKETSYINDTLHEAGDTVELPDGVKPGPNLEAVSGAKGAETGQAAKVDDDNVPLDRPELDRNRLSGEDEASRQMNDPKQPVSKRTRMPGTPNPGTQL